MSDFATIDIPQTMHIETDVEELAPIPEGDKPPHVSKRDEQMAAIALRRQEALEKELAYGVQMEDEARAAGGGEPIDRTASEEVAAAVEAPIPVDALPPNSAAVAAPATPPQRRPITIDGQQFHVTDQELEHLAQIGALTQIAINRQQQHPAPQPEPPPVQVASPEPPSAAATPDKLRDVWRRMSYGNEEDGAAALQELLATARPAAPAIDPNQIAVAASQQALAMVDRREQLLAVGREFPDIFGPLNAPAADAAEARRHQFLSTAAARSYNEILARDQLLGVNRPEIERYREAASDVRTMFRTNAPSQSGATPAPSAATQAAPAVSQERLERKRAAPRQPQAVSRAAVAEQAARQPTGSEIVAWLASKRHQASPVRS